MTATATAADGSMLTPRRLVAALVWAGAVGTTYAGLSVAMGGGYVVWGYAVLIQAALTGVESQIWAGRYRPLALLALGFDVLLNMGGTWVWVRAIDSTPTWAMLVEGAGAPDTLGGLAKLAVCGLIGLLLAYMPEAIWRGR